MDASGLAVFRILYGAVLCAAMIRFLARGWVDDLYVTPQFHFTYPGFSWVRPWPGIGLHLHFAALAALALLIAIGLFTRAATALFLLGFLYIELLDQATYLNHYVLVSLVAALMLFMPMAATWSLDAHCRRGIARATVPAWVVYALRAQLAVVYFFAGLAKVRADWLLRGEPLTTWLHTRAEMPLLGPFLASRWFGLALSWAGAVFDLTIVFFLLARRSRPLAYVVVIVFHLMTGILFNIGVFPFVMIALTTIFFEPDWPRRLLSRTRATGVDPVQPSRPPPATSMRPLTGFALAAYFIVQFGLPLRRYAYSGDTCWSEDGYRFGWTVMLMEKTGLVDFRVETADGQSQVVHPRRYLSPYQVKAMSAQPEMIASFARFLSREFSVAGRQAKVYADAYAALNGRMGQRLIEPSVDLAALDVHPLAPSRFVLPLGGVR